MSASLEQQIGAVQLRLAQHQAMAVSHASATRQLLREKLSSPLVLLAAAAAGFAIYRFNPLRRAKPDASMKSAGAAATWTQLLDALPLVTALVSLLPTLNKKS